MTDKFVRASNFRHVFGNEDKKNSFENIKVTKNTWESPMCAVNSKFLAFCLSSAGGGAFMVLPLEKIGRVPLEGSRVAGHKADVLDIAWNPFNDNIIASSSEDSKIMIWEIPEGGVTDVLTTPLMTLSDHQQRVGIIKWHPTAENIILSAAYDNLIIIWNLEEGIVKQIDCHPKTITCITWNFDGSLIATACRDKKLRIINPRTGELVKEVNGHEGSKPQQIAFIGENNHLFSTGFSRMSDRQFAVWKTNLEERLCLVDIDQSNGVLFIHYDYDTSVLWLIGKGDTAIRYYELVEGEPWWYFISIFSPKVQDSQRGFAFLPKRACNLHIKEIARMYRMTGKGSIIPISFTVPRKAEVFQKDIYPNTFSGEASVSAEEWVQGKNGSPKTISLEDIFNNQGQKVTPSKKLTTIKKKMPVKKTVKAEQPAKEDVEVEKLMKTIEALTARLAKLEKTTTTLASRVAELEANQSQDQEDAAEEDAAEEDAAEEDEQ